MTWRAAGLLPGAACVLAAACGGGGGGATAPAGPPTQFVKNGGDGQSWYFNNPLPTAYGVRALDASNRAVRGVIVSWAVTSGGGSITPTVDTTDATGVASSVQTLGSSASTQTATATPDVAGLPTVTFAASASTPPTVDTVTVNNNFFSPQDVVIQVNHTVTWTWNSGGAPHTVTLIAGPPPLPAETVQSTGSHSTTFTTVGKYSYVCTIHAGMTGTVTVVN